jgi:tyrosinase
MAEVRMRRDVWRLDEWDPILLWYARAIAEMQRRPINDPTSWRYQAAIHDYDRETDPDASPSDQMPSAADQERFWSQCQHNSWFFLPWHRMYLGFFEQIVTAVVRELGGPEDWALPYWNYSDATSPNAARLPPAFRDAQLPDGTPNPLRIEQRADGVNDGDVAGDEDDVDLTTCLEEESFISEAAGGDPGFGGPRTRFNHAGGPMGDLERVPHGSMHLAVGGFQGGWMSAFNTAALDPIFWLHHCNIDRLWAVWRRRDTQHTDPGEPAWLTEVFFEFHDASGSVVSMTPSQVADTTTASFSYDYEDLSDPIEASPERLGAGRRSAMGSDRIPEMVGATDESLTLTGEQASTRLAVSEPTGPARRAGRSDAAPSRIILNLENITGSGQPDSYAVYLNLPPGADPENHRDLYAGLLPMFGVVEASDPGRNHPGSGLQYNLDISEVVRVLEARGDWNPDELRVTFVPKRRRGGRERAASGSSVQVGRVSLYYS